MRIDYRTTVWSFGSVFLLTILFFQIAVWTNLTFEIVKWGVIIITVLGMLVGFYLDQYYKEKESENETDKRSE